MPNDTRISRGVVYANRFSAVPKFGPSAQLLPCTGVVVNGLNAVNWLALVDAVSQHTLIDARQSHRAAVLEHGAAPGAELGLIEHVHHLQLREEPRRCAPPES
jgi:hypothetical protein